MIRLSCLILIASALLSSGCSAIIAQSGADLSGLTTKEKVHEKFGDPAASGASEGFFFEDYQTRRKISEPLRSAHLGMSIAMTYGLGELIAFPYEFSLLGRRTLVGQELSFGYDSAGNVTRVYLDGKWLSFFPKPDHAEPGAAVHAQAQEPR